MAYSPASRYAKARLELFKVNLLDRRFVPIEILLAEHYPALEPGTEQYENYLALATHHRSVNNVFS